MLHRLRRFSLAILTVFTLSLAPITNQNRVTPVFAAELHQQNSANESGKPQVGPDADHDWVSDADEKRFGSNPSLIDTDEDGMTDFEEIYIFHTDPAKPEQDTDKDGFADVVETKLFKTTPNQANPDRDGDLVPDSVELDLGTDPGRQDTDDDLLSDLLELYLLKTNPRVADPDTDGNGYPDAIETWLPQQLQGTICKADITLTIDHLLILDPKEADSLNNMQGGDEALLGYGLRISNTDENGKLIESDADPQAVRVWQGEAFLGSEFSRFAPLATLSARCGQMITLVLQAAEDDAPFGGMTNLGKLATQLRLSFNRLPLGWEYTAQGDHHFKGVSVDGSYDYEALYTLRVALGAFALNQQSSVKSAQPAGDVVSTPEAKSSQALQYSFSIALYGMAVQSVSLRV